jgi:3D (Asp-Asp-Asp) domain-containing protein
MSIFDLIIMLKIDEISNIATGTFAAEPAVRYVILIDGGTTTHETTARTVGTFLEEQNVVLHPLDNINQGSRRRLEDNLVIEIERAFYTGLLIDGDEWNVKVSPGTTAGEVLGMVQRDIETALLYDGNVERIVDERTMLAFSTWRSEIETVIVHIPYDNDYVTTSSLSMGIEELWQEGVMGEQRTESMVVYIGNEEYSREILSDYTIEPVTRIIAHGVGGDLGTLTDTSCPSFRYVRRLTMNATAYTAGFNCTGKHPWHPFYRITASGREVEHGIVAVDPRVIPLGTRLYVEGYGFSLAADVGGAIRGYKIDLFMEDITDALQFGRRDITVFILE